MAKAPLHDDGDFPVARPPPETADQILAAITRLYAQLPTWSDGHRPRLAYTALEAEIHALAVRYWALTR